MSYIVHKPDIIDMNDPDMVQIWLNGQEAIGLSLVSIYMSMYDELVCVFYTDDED